MRVADSGVNRTVIILHPVTEAAESAGGISDKLFRALTDDQIKFNTG